MPLESWQAAQGIRLFDLIEQFTVCCRRGIKKSGYGEILAAASAIMVIDVVHVRHENGIPARSATI